MGRVRAPAGRPPARRTPRVAAQGADPARGPGPDPAANPWHTRSALATRRAGAPLSGDGANP